jgi:hypothetical protein
MSDAVEQIFAGLIADRGGIARFDETQRQICRRIAVMLSDDSADLSASSLNVLLSLMPEKSAAPELDLTKLSDKEFAELDRLTSIAAGVRASKPDKPRRAPLRSPRERLAAELAILLDAIEATTDDYRRRDWRNVPAVSAEDVAAVRGAVSDVIGLAVSERAIAEPWIDEATYPLRTELAQRDAIARVRDVLDAPMIAEPVPVEPPPEARVVPLVFRAPRSPLPGTI